jgi:hypothetical protein
LIDLARSFEPHKPAKENSMPLSDVFIATEAELAATRFEGSGGPGDFFPTVPGKSLDHVKLALLEAIVLELEPDTETLMEMIGRPPIREDESGEQWIDLFSDRLVARLAELTEASISHYGARWASIEEWHSPRAKPLTPKEAATHAAHVTHYLQALCQLARRAQAEGKHMYRWVCL